MHRVNNYGGNTSSSSGNTSGNSSSAAVDDYGDNASQAGHVSVGGSATGRIETVGDRDWFAVTLQAGHRYQIDLEGVPTNKGTLRDPYLRGIYDSHGNLLSGTANDDGGVSHNSRVSFTPSSTGTYYISAGAYGNYTGSYTLSVQDRGVENNSNYNNNWTSTHNESGAGNSAGSDTSLTDAWDELSPLPDLEEYDYYNLINSGQGARSGDPYVQYVEINTEYYDAINRLESIVSNYSNTSGTNVGTSTHSNSGWSGTSLGTNTWFDSDWGGTSLGSNTHSNSGWSGTGLGTNTWFDSDWGGTSLGSNTHSNSGWSGTSLGTNTWFDSDWGGTSLGSNTHSNSGWSGTGLGTNTWFDSGWGGTSLGSNSWWGENNTNFSNGFEDSPAYDVASGLAGLGGALLNATWGRNNPLNNPSQLLPWGDDNSNSDENFYNQTSSASWRFEDTFIGGIVTGVSNAVGTVLNWIWGDDNPLNNPEQFTIQIDDGSGLYW